MARLVFDQQLVGGGSTPRRNIGIAEPRRPNEAPRLRPDSPRDFAGWALPPDVFAIIEPPARGMGRASQRQGQWRLRLACRDGALEGPLAHLDLRFASPEEATRYARRAGIDYELRLPPSVKALPPRWPRTAAAPLSLCCWPTGPHALCCGHYPWLSEEARHVPGTA